jgi:hypothetical protein
VIAVPQATVIEPPEALLRVVDLIEEGIRQVVQVSPRQATRRVGEYEAPVEGMVLVSLQARYLEAICELARRDVVLLPGALVLARSILETGARTLWLLAPDDVFESEARWLAHLKTEEDWLNRAGNLVEQIGADPGMYRQRATQVQEFREAVTGKLPAGTPVPARVPDLRSMLRSLGEERKYLGYIRLSQFAHGTIHAGGLYRRNLGTEKELAEDVKPEDWKAVFSAAWPAFVASSGVLYVKHLGAPPPFTREFEGNVLESIENIR